jgi:hypothetical protein
MSDLPDQNIPTTDNIFIANARELATLRTLVERLALGQSDLNHNIEGLRSDWCRWVVDNSSASSNREAACRETLTRQQDERVKGLRKHVYVLYTLLFAVVGTEHFNALAALWPRLVALFS